MANHAVAAERSFSIPPQRLDTALAAFRIQSGVTIFYRPDLAAASRSTGVIGRLEPDAALTRLLAGSHFELRRVEQGFVVLPGAPSREAPSSAPPSVITGVASAPVVPAPETVSVAKPQPAPPALTAELERVVVTGSFIRGIAPVGVNLQSLNRQDLQRVGPISTNQILANVPIISNLFNTTATTPTTVFLSVFRPTIRNIAASGGNTTLVLVDGHNQVGVGTLQTTPDAGMIPPGALERMEILADGGSALYGADAVTGAVNYITRTRFEGFEVATRRGTAEGGYEAFDVNLTAGRIWDNGSAMLALSTRGNSPLFASSRERPRQDLRPFGGTDFRVRTCPAANVTAEGINYALPSLLPGTLNLCDGAAAGNIVPEEHAYSLFTSLTGQVGGRLHLELKGFWASRVTKSRLAQLVGRNLTIDNNNPFFRPIAGETSQIVNFSFEPYLGPRLTARNAITQYSLTPELTWMLAGDWQARALINRGWSRTQTETPSLTPYIGAYLNGAGLTPATALNPYNLLATNPQTLESLTRRYKTIGHAIQTLDDVRLQADGPLFRLLGGQARGAIGAEWQRSTLNALAGVPATGLSDSMIGRGTAEREVFAVFGQLAMPLVGPDNARPFVQSLLLDLSARYDRYSDFGSTPNPKLAFTWGVINGLKLRGNWGTAFNAPSLGDTTGDSAHRAEFAANTVALPPGSSLDDEGQRPSIAITGGNPDLKPQTARTWSVGADLNPPRLKNLQLAATFWSIDVKDIVGLAPRSDTLFSLAGYRAYYTLNPTLAQVRALVGDLPLTNFPTPDLADLYGAGLDPLVLIDVRKDNFGSIKAQGLDFRASYRRPTAWGSAFASIAGTRPTRREQSAIAGAPTANLLAADNSKLSVSTTLGMTVGAFTASVTQNFSQGYPLATTPGQSRIGDFAPVNLALRYELGGGGSPNGGLSLSLNIDNIADRQPPLQNIGTGSGAGTGNGSTLGRYINLGLQKSF
jgi:iron complex outermembrane receptor protein